MRTSLITGISPPGSANVNPVLNQLSPDMTARVKKMTHDSLEVGHDESVTINAFANAVKGSV